MKRNELLIHTICVYLKIVLRARARHQKESIVCDSAYIKL